MDRAMRSVSWNLANCHVAVQYDKSLLTLCFTREVNLQFPGRGLTAVTTRLADHER